MQRLLDEFAAEVRRSDEDLRLDRAALLIAAAEYPTLDIDTYLFRLEALAYVVRERAAGGGEPRRTVRTLNDHLFAEAGFHGNAEDYYDPRNSYLSDVLDRRTGIPISLSALWLVTAWRLGLEAAGVGFPRHFLVRYRNSDGEWLVDPYGGGHELPASEFRQRAAQQSGAQEQMLDYLLAAVTRRQILSRMLANLKSIYLGREDTARALRIQEFVVALTPWSFADIRDRGVLRGRAGDVDGAIHDLETYLEHAHSEGDVPVVHELLDRLRA